MLTIRRPILFSTVVLTVALLLLCSGAAIAHLASQFGAAWTAPSRAQGIAEVNDLDLYPGTTPTDRSARR